MSSTWMAVGQIPLLLAALAAAHRPLGAYLAAVYTSPRHLHAERAGYRLRVWTPTPSSAGPPSSSRSSASRSPRSSSSTLGRLQHLLPMNLGVDPFDPAGAWNTAVSFVSNTNWQWYSGAVAAGSLFEMVGLAVQNSASAAVGI